MMLKDKVAIITGGARGIGKAITLKMAAEGANVAIVYLLEDESIAEETRLQAEAFGVRAKIYRSDISDKQQVKDLGGRILEDFGTVDILVNNAGVTRDKLLIMMEEEDFDKVINVNLKGAFLMMHEICPIMVKKRWGRIINIASVAGMMGNPGQANYAASKAGLIGLTKTLAKELGSRNITVNAISPGWIDTDMTSALTDKIKEATDRLAIKRIGQPEDIANLAVFIAGDGASYVTGEVIKVDGGLYI